VFFNKVMDRKVEEGWRGAEKEEGGTSHGRTKRKKRNKKGARLVLQEREMKKDFCNRMKSRGVLDEDLNL